MVTPRGGRRRALVEALGVAVVAVLVGNAVGFATVFSLRSLDVSLTTLDRILVSIVCLQGVGFLGVSLLYLDRGDHWDLVRVRRPTRGDLLIVFAGFVGAFVVAVVFSLIVVALGYAPQTAITQAGQQDPTTLLWVIVVSTFVVVPIEEFLFRGVVQTRLRRAFGPRVAVPVAAVLFASMHFPGFTGVLGGKLLTVATLVLVALVLGIVYERTDNLAVPILVHATYNATLLGLAYVALTHMPG